MISHVEFQEEIARSLLGRPGAILQQQSPHHPKTSCNPHTKTVCKTAHQEHAWGKLGSYGRCQVCNQRPGRPRRQSTALQELSVNALNNEKSSGKGIHRTVHECINCSISISRNSHCWARQYTKSIAKFSSLVVFCFLLGLADPVLRFSVMPFIGSVRFKVLLASKQRPIINCVILRLMWWIEVAYPMEKRSMVRHT